MKKRISSPDYNLLFDTDTGFMARWGKTAEDDPQMCPIGPELADIEISTVCHGIGKSMASRKPCSFCYKSNTGVGENMSLDTFVTIFDKFPPTLTQIAFGIGDIDGNPDLWDILKHCRDNGVVPNLTTNGMGVYQHPDVAKKLADVCGAIAVSHYGDHELCFGAVKELSEAGLKQVNIHKLLAEETLDSCFKLLDQAATDPRLKDHLKAIVFLMLKPKGARNRYHPIESLADYKRLVDRAQQLGVAIGMDSCSAPMAFRSLDEKQYNYIEPCESTLFSIYVNVRGEVFPCSFTEGTPGWEKGIDLKTVNNFKTDVWDSARLSEWRGKLLKSSESCSGCSVQKHCRSCPVYDITLCKGGAK